MSRTRSPLAAIAIAFVLILAACSSDGGDGDEDSPTDDPAVTTTTEPTGADDPDAPDGYDTGEDDPADTGEDDPADTGDDEAVDADADDYAAALASGFESGDAAAQPLDEREVACFTHGLVDLVGADRYAEAGITPDELEMNGPFPPEVDFGLDRRDDVYAVFVDCDIDTRQMVLSLVLFLTEEPDAESCFESALKDEAVVRDLIVGLMGLTADAELDEAFEAIDACLEDAG